MFECKSWSAHEQHKLQVLGGNNAVPERQVVDRYGDDACIRKEHDAKRPSTHPSNLMSAARAGATHPGSPSFARNIGRSGPSTMKDNSEEQGCQEAQRHVNLARALSYITVEMRSEDNALIGCIRLVALMLLCRP